MHRTMIHIALSATVLVLMVTLAGCPQPVQPPFDASGQYAGTWTTNDGEKLSCDLNLELYQLVDVPIIKFTVAGTATFSWDCIIPENVQDLLRQFLGLDAEDLMPDLTLPILGQMDRDSSGHIAMSLGLDLSNMPQALLDLLPLEISVEDLPLSQFELAFDGYGEDLTESGVMEQFTGTFSLDATVTLGDEPQVLDLEGTFALDRVGDVAK